MKKVIFQTYKPYEYIREVIEYEDDTTDDEIRRDFIEWMCEQHDSCWYVEGEQ